MSLTKVAQLNRDGARRVNVQLTLKKIVPASVIRTAALQIRNLGISPKLADVGVEQFPSQNQHSFRHHRENAFGCL